MTKCPVKDKPNASCKEKGSLEELTHEELDEMLEEIDFLKSYRPCCSF
jgi:hypothetical protein